MEKNLAISHETLCILSKPVIPPLQIFPEENTVCSYSMWYHLQELITENLNVHSRKPSEQTMVHPSIEYYSHTEMSKQGRMVSKCGYEVIFRISS